VKQFRIPRPAQPQASGRRPPDLTRATWGPVREVTVQQGEITMAWVGKGARRPDHKGYDEGQTVPNLGVPDMIPPPW